VEDDTGLCRGIALALEKSMSATTAAESGEMSTVFTVFVYNQIDP
jgi:hypothetical protein